MIDVKGAELKEIWKNYSDSLVERYHVKHFAKDCDVSPDTIQRLFRGSATKDVLKVVCGVLSRCTGKRLEVSRFQVVAPQELAVDQNHNGGLQNVRK